MTAIIQQDISDCLSKDAKDARLSADHWQAVLTRADDALAGLSGRTAQGPLRLPAEGDDLAELADIAAEWRGRFKRIVLLGVGGSSLGARALAALAPADVPVLAVPDNLDPNTMARVLDPALLDGTGFLAISKSGGTVDTLTQTLAVVSQLGGQALGDRFLIVTEPGARPLRKFGEEIGARIIDHDTDIDGRYSVLSNVGMLPALLLGLDALAVRQGAAAVLDQALVAKKAADCPAAAAAALNVAYAEQHGIRQTVLFYYADRLQPMATWFRQIWAESLGKGGAGTTPIDALGPLEQHSQLQLYLDGPRDKFFTVLTLDQAGKGLVADADMARRIGAGELAGRSIGDFVDASGRATADALAARGLPVRRLRLAQFNEESLGALFMQFMLETLLAADLLGVDPFGQPAVEEGKVLMRRYLAGDGGAD